MMPDQTTPEQVPQESTPIQPLPDHNGWMGTKGQLLHVLGTMGCDRDAKGFHVDGPIFSFMGIDMGDATEMVVGAEAVYYVGGKAVPLVGVLYSTSYGLKAIVIG